MVYDSTLVAPDATKSLVGDELPVTRGFPQQSHCYHSRWSQHYRDNIRLLPGADNELSPWLAKKLKGNIICNLF
jgi:hypothetical protein